MLRVRSIENEGAIPLDSKLHRRACPDVDCAPLARHDVFEVKTNRWGDDDVGARVAGFAPRSRLPLAIGGRHGGRHRSKDQGDGEDKFDHRKIRDLIQEQFLTHGGHRGHRAQVVFDDKLAPFLRVLRGDEFVARHFCDAFKDVI